MMFYPEFKPFEILRSLFFPANQQSTYTMQCICRMEFLIASHQKGKDRRRFFLFLCRQKRDGKHFIFRQQIVTQSKTADSDCLWVKPHKQIRLLQKDHCLIQIQIRTVTSIRPQLVQIFPKPHHIFLIISHALQKNGTENVLIAI